MPRVGGSSYLFISVYLAVSNLFRMHCLKYSFSLCLSISSPQIREGLRQGYAFPFPILSNKYLKGEAESTEALVLSQRQRRAVGFVAVCLHLLNSRRLVPCAVGRNTSKSKQECAHKQMHTRASEHTYKCSTLTTGLICKD